MKEGMPEEGGAGKGGPSRMGARRKKWGKGGSAAKSPRRDRAPRPLEPKTEGKSPRRECNVSRNRHVSEMTGLRKRSLRRGGSSEGRA